MKLPKLARLHSPAGSVRDHGLPTTRAGSIAPAASWSMTQNNTSGSTYESKVSLTYRTEPEDGCDCDQIAFIQAVQRLEPNGDVYSKSHGTPRATETGWRIDRLQGKEYGWYGLNDNGTFAVTVTPGRTSTSTAAVMRDTPSSNRLGQTWSFETCAVCYQGTDANKIYGCKTWGFKVDDEGSLTSSQSTESTSPSVNWTASVSQWNQQANTQGDSNLQSPNQQKLGTLTNFF